MSIRDKWRELFGKGLEKGVHKYDGKGEFARHRFHLRVDSEMKGILLIDASGIIFLNGTAVDYIRLVLEDRADKQAARYIQRRYKNVDKSAAIEHYHQVSDQLVGFIKGEHEIIEIIGSDRPNIGLDDFPAPYRMDLALTYSCQNQCEHCYNEPREMKELTLEEWKSVISKLWKLGVPHIVFTGGEPTLFEGLDELIAKSEEFGQVTGLVSNGRRLGESCYLRDLVKVGLDHVQITVLSHRECLHDQLVGAPGAWKETIEGLKVALLEDLYVSTNTTIMRSNLDDIEDTIRFLISLGVKHIAFNGIIRSGKGLEAEGITYSELATMMTKLKAIAEEFGVKVIWYTPTPYHEFNPVNFGLGIKQCTACSLNMAIEPDGAVLPCQSYYKPLGNILTDSWEKIWNHELCKSIRERKYLDGECLECGMRDVCGGGCPLAREYGDYVCLDRHSTM